MSGSGAGSLRSLFLGGGGASATPLFSALGGDAPSAPAPAPSSFGFGAMFGAPPVASAASAASTVGSGAFGFGFGSEGADAQASASGGAISDAPPVTRTPLGATSSASTAAASGGDADVPWAAPGAGWGASAAQSFMRQEAEETLRENWVMGRRDARAAYKKRHLDTARQQRLRARGAGLKRGSGPPR